MILNAFLLALRQIRRNFLRAFLTMLGIIIGVGAVVVMISLGNGMSKQITDRISSLGSNIIIVYVARGLPKGMIKKEFSDAQVNEVKAIMGGNIAAIAPIANSSALMQYGANNSTSQVQGTTKSYFDVAQWDISDGRSFEDSEYLTGGNVCILGQSVRKNLFGANTSASSVLGKKVRLSNIVCEVVGILEEKGQGGMGNDQDDILLLPMKTYLRSIEKPKTLHYYKRIMIRTPESADSADVVAQLTLALRKARNVKQGERDNFEIMDTKQIADTLNSTTSMLTAFLGLIAGVSLIVGGIGIMNIMLVSVTERTKEIGTRMAIGALQSEVLMQFLIESVTLSSLGGLIGVLWAFFASWGLSSYMDIPFIFDVPTALIAFIFSAFIGILFGYLPARRASKLNPIDALRHE